MTALDNHAAIIARELDSTLSSLAYYLTQHDRRRDREDNRERMHERLRLRIPIARVARDAAAADLAAGRRTIARAT